MPHAESMRITCLRILGDDAEALDALQDTLIKLWQHADELSIAENVGAYCRRTAHNVSISRLRSSNRTERWADDEPVVSDNWYVAERIVKRDELEHVRHMMSKLPDQQRSVLEMRSLRDMEVDEIAANMHLSESNVRQLLSRLRHLPEEGEMADIMQGRPRLQKKRL